jgi:hypothetical protein
MDGSDARPLESRFPTTGDLVALCRLLNAENAKYIVIDGWAMIEHGVSRTTADIDILLERSRDNQQRVRRALQHLPDAAVNEMAEGDLDNYQVVRVPDEIVVDLMLVVCGMSFAEVEDEIHFRQYGDVRIPFASRNLMIRLKRTPREKDRLDLAFLLRAEEPAVDHG